MATNNQFGEDDETFWEKYRGLLIVALLVLLGGGFILSKILGKKAAPPPREQSITMISLPPMPPPPPKPTPPPPQATPPPVDQKMDEQRPMEPQEAVKPDEAPPKPDTPPDQPMGTNNVGAGPGDNFGLGGPGGNGGFGGGGKGGQSGSKYGWYAGQVQSRIQSALQQNRRTKNASLRIEVRIWPDSTGRVTRAELKTSTGDPALDNAIRSEVLNNLQLQQPPPAGMPLPIVLRLTARRPV